MISKSIQSCREAIYRDLQQCRRGTFKLFTDIDYDNFCRQAHPDFSPVGWHLGHIAYTEDLWLLQRCAGLKPVFPEYHQLFAADILPKKQRVFLPTLPEVELYLDAVRKKVLDYLEVAPIDEQERLWRFIIQHESQHCEISSFVLELVKSQESRGGSHVRIFSPLRSHPYVEVPDARLLANAALSVEGSGVELAFKSQECRILPLEMIQIPAGEFEQGSDSIKALDNERFAHRVYLNTYLIDRYPVTCEQYRVFMEAGGYQNSRWWSQSGWQWLQTESVTQPLYWCDARSWDNHPVCGVSWYEAEAYSRFVGKRLPTEAEWEKAVSWDSQVNRHRTYPWGDEELTTQRCNCDRLIGRTTPVNAYPAGQSAYGLDDTLGNVWEWTASWFNGYNGFQSYPYTGYSQVYFGDKHRVLKGGSWATPPWILRSSFRNWYHPGVRQIFAGFRCAAD